MTEFANIRKLEESDFDQLLSISDLQFGDGYLTKSDLLSYLHDDTKIGIVYLTEQKLSGFSFCHVYSKESVHLLDLEGQNWFKEEYKDKCPIGVIKSIAVDQNASGKGIGTHLAQVSIEELNKHTDCIISPCWQQGEHTPFANLLEKLDFSLVKTFDDFWNEDSLLKKYPCKICGSPPCLCKMLLYQNKV
jgi:GNAT superfamily N-acetyltransferase